MVKKYSIKVYVIGVIVVMAIILCVTWFSGESELFTRFVNFFAAFLLGMLAMWIAVHVYRT
jgi:uncharacterized membrane protein YccC